MPYNTRRKSISLTALGVHLPQHYRTAPPVSAGDAPPQKRVKRVHEEPKGRSRPLFDPTPPPSPPASQDSFEDEEVDDEVVSSVVKVLKQSGNRPHTVRELAFLLNSSGVHIVENSANPHAIISSRLNTYLKRGNATKQQPCLLEKKLVTAHPKRIYFYLSGMKALPIPDTELPTLLAHQRNLASPAPTDEDAEDEEEELRRRRILSPSPEVDLSSHEIEHDDNMSDTSNPSSIISRERTTSPMRYASPPLEGDEKEFSASAISLSIKHRTASIQLQKRLSSPPAVVVEEAEPLVEGDHHTAAALLGYSVGAPAIPSSPLVQPLQNDRQAMAIKRENAMDIDAHSPLSRPVLKSLSIITPLKLDCQDENWGDLRSPETVALHELDDLLEDL